MIITFTTVPHYHQPLEEADMFHILALTFAICVTLDKECCLSVPQFPQLQNRNNKVLHLTGMFRQCVGMI